MRGVTLSMLSILGAIQLFALSAMADTIVSANHVSVTGSSGATPVIQVEGALGGDVQGANPGNPANSGRRTVYFFQSDIDMSSQAPTYVGSTWAVVFHDAGSLIVDPSVTGVVTLGAVQATGLVDGGGNPIERSPVLINDKPVYQFFRDSQESFNVPTSTPSPDATGLTNVNGIYGSWYAVAFDGAIVVPEPSTAILLAGGLGLLSWRRRLH